jgi:sodium/potassium/calcium exchanger 2
MGGRIIPAATRRALRPYKFGLVLSVACIACVYGYLRGAWEDVADGRRLTQLDSEVATISDGAERPSLQWAMINLAGLLYMFLALSIVCDEFFVPALEVITENTGLSPDVAGATFMAAGGSAPEFFTSVVGSLAYPPSDVGIATIVGSAVFNVLFVIGACGIAAPTTLQLTGYPLARESLFSVLHLATLVAWFWDGKVELWESGVQFCLYVVYAIFMAYSSKVEDMINDRLEYSNLDADGDGFITKAEASKDSEVAAAFDKLDVDNDGKLSKKEVQLFFRHRRQMRKIADEVEHEDEPAATLMPPAEGGAKAWIYYILALPIHVALIFTVPDVRRTWPGTFWKKLYPVEFLFAIVWVAIFSYSMVKCSEVVGDWSGVDERILALTLLAAGTSVPDLLTSVIVTLQGHGDMAISSSIGSNIFDVCVGLPVPWMIFSVIYGEPVQVFTTPKTMCIQVGSLVAMLLVVILSIMWANWKLSKPLGYVMIVLYVGFMVVSIYQVTSEGE